MEGASLFSIHLHLYTPFFILSLPKIVWLTIALYKFATSAFYYQRHVIWQMVPEALCLALWGAGWDAQVDLPRVQVK